MRQPIYVLGTGVSHNGSAVLLRDGEVAVAIEKERLTRVKHDGGNDLGAVNYCLEAEGISIDDLSLVVQSGLFELPDRGEFEGPRPWKDHPDLQVVTISHHLAHAYSAVGTAPFDEFDILVVDGCGSPREHCANDRAETELGHCAGAQAEKDSFYRWSQGKLHSLIKDFSPPADRYLYDIRMPSTAHSIGGFYAAVSGYCLGSMSDVGKLMGLAPYGSKPELDLSAFDWLDDQLIVRNEWRTQLRKPRVDHQDFAHRFDYFANVALWAQQQVERAMQELVARRRSGGEKVPLALSGGVALNAVANAKLLTSGLVDELYIEPAAGDNGIALGCAFYGWIAALGQPRVAADGSTCFGRALDQCEVDAVVESLSDDEQYAVTKYDSDADLLAMVAEQIADGATVGWMQDGAEFGPRALGRRSILAHPGLHGLRDHINRNIKFREDFRPFAPSMLPNEVDRLLVYGHESPYMILVDEVRPDCRSQMANVMHVDGSTRVQVVDQRWNPRYYELLQAVKARTGLGVVLNTSFNKKGQPIVETPAQASALFRESQLDVLVIGQVVATKPQQAALHELGNTAVRSRCRLPRGGHGAEVSSRADLEACLQLIDGDLALDAKIETAFFQAWIRQGGTGCLFAQNRAQRPQLANYSSHLLERRPDVSDFDDLQNALMSSCRHEAALVHLPRVTTERELADLMLAFGRSEHWFLSWSADPGSPEHALVGLRWPVPGSFVHSEVLGFADLACLPATRRAPTTTLMLRTTPPPAGEPTVHLAQIPYSPSEAERTDFYWQGTRTSRKALIQPDEHESTQAPVTFRLNASLWAAARREIQT